MRTRRPSKASRGPKRHDPQLEEFEAKDLGADIEASGVGVAGRRKKPTSILLDDELVKELREKGARRGLGYQTMRKVIVREHIDEY